MGYVCMTFKIFDFDNVDCFKTVVLLICPVSEQLYRYAYEKDEMSKFGFQVSPIVRCRLCTNCKVKVVRSEPSN